MTARLKRKKSLIKNFSFFFLLGRFGKFLFSDFVIVFYIDESQTKTKKKIEKKKKIIFSAGRVWYTITPPIGEIEKFCFQPSSSFSIAMTARLKRKKSLTIFFFIFFLLGGFVTP